jgi:hypothetical protein
VERASDTSPDAAAIQLAIHRRLSGVERLNLALKMSAMARELAETRLRREHPSWTDADLKRELLRYAFQAQPLPVPLR